MLPHVLLMPMHILVALLVTSMLLLVGLLVA